MGLANRILGRFARRAYVAWEEAASSFPRHTLRAYGVPLRAGFAPTPYLPAATPRVLVMGGSQGAAALNERLPKALGRIAARGRSAAIVHQAGRGRDLAVREAYAREGLGHASVVPFIDDVAAAIRWSAGLDVPGVPRNTHKADVINLSLGIGLACRPELVGAMLQALNAARNAGTIVVVAAGNDADDLRWRARNSFESRRDRRGAGSFRHDAVAL